MPRLPMFRGEKTNYVIEGQGHRRIEQIIKIDFRVALRLSDETCAEHSANDRMNNAQRSWSDTAQADSVYLWHSIRLGGK
jgi:hypothetical protein